MNIIEIILLIGFIETVTLFIYALRWYLFAFVSLKASRVAENQDCDLESSFVSVLLPIYNEVNVVDRLLKACTSFNSPPYEVVVVDDSNDGVTSEKLSSWQKHPKVKVLHRDSRMGWKGGALNFGLDNADPESTHVIIFDADFVPSSDLIDRFLTRFNDDRIAAVQGYQKHDLNADENWITRGVRVWHSLFNMIELNGLQKLGNYTPLTGSVYMVRTDVLRKLKFEGVMTEDTDLTVRLYENGYRIWFDPTLTASGECPNTLRRILTQQMRWAEGHTRIFRKHFSKIMRSKFLSIPDKINFFLIGYSFLNSIPIFALMTTWLMTTLFPAYFLPLPLVHTGLLLFLISAPSAIFASLVALTLEGAKKDFSKIANAWIVNLIMTPAVAYASLKGLLKRDGYFYRTYKTGKVIGRNAEPDH